MLDAASVFNILRQLLASWPDIEIMCLELPPCHGNELDDCPPMRTLRELRCSGVPPTTLLDMLSEPGHQFSRLVIVDPALVPTVADAGVTSFPEEFIVPSSTQELTIVGDLAAYKLDFLRAQQIKTVTWDWQSPNSPDPDAISRIADAHLPASIETFALSAYYVASTHAEGQLEGALTYLASELTSLRRITLGAADDALDLFGFTREEIVTGIRTAFLDADIVWSEEITELYISDITQIDNIWLVVTRASTSTSTWHAADVVYMVALARDRKGDFNVCSVTVSSSSLAS
ncbi:hypothetical protein EXIGLDRAFT_754517 [Exidia glandulosa HHB12029]|uniref:Uncharacterized protein n=1 Tax=Exidia glandulosa HHB12029 TaxID=1314781 RepID=A0A165CVZ4_EXIGL|nr:hypothetical protein EXIGLDRAFT_754517 [Exidia glandulosa HHB12029]